MPPVVHNQAGALHEYAVAAMVLAHEVCNTLIQVLILHSDLLVGTGRHGL